MKKLFNYCRCKATGYYLRFKTGKCGLHLYYNGCYCEECSTYYKTELEEFKDYSIKNTK